MDLMQTAEAVEQLRKRLAGCPLVSQYVRPAAPLPIFVIAFDHAVRVEVVLDDGMPALPAAPIDF